MTDLEISKALALAIGWPENKVIVDTEFNYDSAPLCVLVWKYRAKYDSPWTPFDYRDWNVIGPIAERYVTELIRCRSGNGPIWWECHVGMEHEKGHAGVNGDIPQKAIAMAVIAGAKK